MPGGAKFHSVQHRYVESRKKRERHSDEIATQKYHSAAPVSAGTSNEQKKTKNIEEVRQRRTQVGSDKDKHKGGQTKTNTRSSDKDKHTELR